MAFSPTGCWARTSPAWCTTALKRCGAACAPWWAPRYHLPVIAIVGNDARWNAEYPLQLRRYGAERAVGCKLRTTRHDKLIAAPGGHGEFVEHSKDLAGAITRAVRSGLPACVNGAIEGLAAPTFGEARPARQR